MIKEAAIIFWLQVCQPEWLAVFKKEFQFGAGGSSSTKHTEFIRWYFSMFFNL